MLWGECIGITLLVGCACTNSFWINRETCLTRLSTTSRNTSTWNQRWGFRQTNSTRHKQLVHINLCITSLLEVGIITQEVSGDMKTTIVQCHRHSTFPLLPVVCNSWERNLVPAHPRRCLLVKSMHQLVRLPNIVKNCLWIVVDQTRILLICTRSHLHLIRVRFFKAIYDDVESPERGILL